MNAENVTCFDNFGVGNISKEIIKALAENSIMYGYFFIVLIDFMLKVKVRYSVQIYFFLTNVKKKKRKNNTEIFSIEFK